ncbi:MAG: type II toxin-antitoxin system YafQ family toxin [Verrucomicrobiota bacterium]
MKIVFQTSQFKKDFKRTLKRGKDIEKLKQVIRLITIGQPLEERHRDHALGGNWSGSRDCHIEPDWILIYRIEDQSLFLERIGSYSDLFR